MMDVFSKLDTVSVQTQPFPYVVIDDVLPADLCDALTLELPPLEVLTRGAPLGSNQRFTMSHADAVTTAGVSALWRDVLAQAVSKDFLARMIRLFGSSIRSAYPDFEDRFAPLSELVAAPRAVTPRRRNVVGMDAQIAVNTPALTAGTSVRTPHLDRPDKLFVGLLYLRLPEDDSNGADLELLAHSDAQATYGPKRMLPRDSLTHVRTVPYRRNTLVLFLNTPNSLHGVTPRQATPHPRYFINLVGEMAEPLFSVECASPARNLASRAFLNPAGWLERVRNRFHGIPG